MKSIFKLTARTVRTHFGRYIAILLIVALSAGFFAGLKVTKDAMVNTGDCYLQEQNFHDFRLYSTLGFTEEDVKAFGESDGIKSSEGGYTSDALIRHDDSGYTAKFISLPESIDLPSLRAGRMPEASDECLADDERFSEADIGTVIYVSEDNADGVFEKLGSREYTIVGICDSPLYLNMDRGTTDIGNGALHTYLYVPSDSFNMDVYTEVKLNLSESAPAYSDEYDAIVEEHEQDVKELCDSLADARYNSLASDILLSMGLPEDTVLTEEVKESLASSGLSEPETYLLTRDENAGYVSFENDTSIISGVANIFPVFFILIAMLVCMTTMTRMVDEERTQIGVLKAMGYNGGAIMAKYLLYAGSATLIGWCLGFFLCTWALPEIFWFAYGALYDFAPLKYLFSPSLALVTLAVSLLSILGSTYLSCRKELGCAPAKLIRPRAAKNGKRILLERFTPLWKRLAFLQKITLRNMFRYKKRFIMMLVGISCCCALVVTAFGVRDSMLHIGSLQFEEIQKYDLEVSFDADGKESFTEELEKTEGVEEYLLTASRKVDVSAQTKVSSVTLMSFRDTERLEEFFFTAKDGELLPYPSDGEVLINSKIAEKLSLKEGDVLQVQDSDMNSCRLEISGVYDNYIFNYIIINEKTYADTFGTMDENTALVHAEDSQSTAERIISLASVNGVTQTAATRDTVDNALSCLNYIIWLIIGFSAALAFIVIFNLTNINLAERSREIATVQVLGFYPKETESYVLNENIALSVIAGLMGLPLGRLFHRVVMSMVLIDNLTFDIHVEPQSYLYAFIFTVFFAFAVNIIMKRQVDKIKMAESLKAVE